MAEHLGHHAQRQAVAPRELELLAAYLSGAAAVANHTAEALLLCREPDLDQVDANRLRGVQYVVDYLRRRAGALRSLTSPRHRRPAND